MRARDLAVDYPSVGIDSDALDAARLMAGQQLPALLVVDAGGVPAAILPASQMVKTLVPDYVIEDPALAALIDEKHADRLGWALAGRRVGDCLPAKALPLPVADPDDTALEVAALMAQVRSPLVAVVETDERGRRTRLIGVITASHLVNRLLGET
ncbi:CBS domain-containing protein [Streptomyces pinistramenti]|uniref:CBS domain-containing protein n=1 Tax=Streptomyces pinistramenti TaxID=2884812 RepID=UPI001D063F08|nr:CBS domain-containing protein [Streptomyces pinistramenti]MCB5908619.1 CBS domain-containing protein [Streptomyces pinistramenti]